MTPTCCFIVTLITRKVDTLMFWFYMCQYIISPWWFKVTLITRELDTPHVLIWYVPINGSYVIIWYVSINYSYMLCCFKVTLFTMELDNLMYWFDVCQYKWPLSHSLTDLKIILWIVKSLKVLKLFVVWFLASASSVFYTFKYRI